MELEQISTQNRLEDIAKISGAYGQLMGSLQELLGENKKFAIAQATFSFVQELANIAAAANAPTFKNSTTNGALGMALTIINSVSATARYAANIQKLAEFGGGGQFITNGKQQITVGDNPGGKELVTVQPIGNSGQTRITAQSRLNPLRTSMPTLPLNSITNTVMSANKLQQKAMNQPVLVVEDYRRVDNRVTTAESFAKF